MSKEKTKKKKKKVKTYKITKFHIFVYVLVFSIAWLPLLLPLIGTTNAQTIDFSTYNQNWNGCSDLRESVDNMGYTTKSLVSSISTTNKQVDPGVLVIIGPSIGYSLFDITALIGYVLAGGSVLIADDFGSANQLFDPLNLLIGDAAGFSIRFESGVLHDFGSYDRNPVLPLISIFSQHPTTQGVDEILLNYASIINITIGGQTITDYLGSSTSNSGDPTLMQSTSASPDLSEVFGLLGLSTPFSWLDENGNGLPDPGNETSGPFVVGLALDLAPISQLLGLNTTAGRLILFSDPSLFVNDMIGRYDNQRFATQMVDWLANSNTSRIIAFDEGHLRWDLTSSVVYYAMVLGQVLQVSGNWILAPFAPISLFFLAKRWLPKSQEIPEYSTTKVFKRKGKTQYKKELEVLRKYKTYNKPLKILYDKWKKDLVSNLELSGWVDIDVVFEKVSKTRPDLDLKHIRKIINIIENPKKKITQDTFIDIFLTMKGFLAELSGNNVYKL
ncbi:MAG: DUF4350 domain-containing protein [Candidatus Ranarchaeia archaeon]